MSSLNMTGKAVAEIGKGGMVSHAVMVGWVAIAYTLGGPISVAISLLGVLLYGVEIIEKRN